MASFGGVTWTGWTGTLGSDDKVVDRKKKKKVGVKNGK